MDDSSLVSVIIPVYNGERYLAEALQSVLSQTYRPLEIVVVDDGSTDGSAQVVRSFSQVHCIQQQNAGVAAARNAGISASHGEFVAFLDQDDLWAPEKLSVQVAYLRKHPEIGYALARQRFFLQPGTNRPAWLKEQLLQGDQVGYLPGTMVVRSTVLGQIGPFDTAYGISSDSDWFARAKDCGILMSILPQVLLFRRIHDGNLSSEVQRIQSELLKILRGSIARQRAAQASPRDWGSGR
jgi:glycosyltransferase involved in cell wall biosynthesis